MQRCASFSWQSEGVFRYISYHVIAMWSSVISRKRNTHFNFLQVLEPIFTANWNFVKLDMTDK